MRRAHALGGLRPRAHRGSGRALARAASAALDGACPASDDGSRRVSDKCLSPCDAAALNEGSLGCSFSVPPTLAYASTLGSCGAVFVANTWSSPATLRVEHEGKERALDDAVWVPYVEDGTVKHKKMDGPIPPGGGAVVFVSGQDEGVDSRYSIDCPPGVKPLLPPSTKNATEITSAVFVTTDVPVSMYSIFPYGGAASQVSSATLLLPTTSYRRKYVFASAWGGNGYRFGQGVLVPDAPAAATQPGMPTLQIVALEDDTSVDLVPKVAIVGGEGVAKAPRNKVTSYALRRGEILQIVQDNELTGSVIESTKPVGVFGGHTCMNVPIGVGTCDAETEQVPPISAWGNEYAVLPAPNRPALRSKGPVTSRDPSVVRIVGARNGTQLTYEPSVPAGAPTKVEAGELAAFFVNDPFVVRSQDEDHAFHVDVVMTGQSEPNSASTGDPEVAPAVPTRQWLDDYGFFSDYTYDLSAVFVTRRKVDGAFRDVELDCAGVLTSWRPITSEYEWTYVDLTRYTVAQAYAAGSCFDGPHRIHSDGPFTMTVWGLGGAVSYAYPGGTGLRPRTELEAPVN